MGSLLVTIIESFGLHRNTLRVLVRYFCIFALPIMGFSDEAFSQPTSDYKFPPNTVNFTLQGCRNDGAPYPPAGPYICADNKYTTGNLKSWNELDLVPFRLTARNSGGEVTYDVLIGIDHDEGGTIGFDVISDPISSECSVDFVYPEYLENVTGGVDLSMLRQVRITHPANTTCVFDWTSRLALGSSGYTGSSLQGYMFETNTKQGKRTVPINDEPKPILFSKVMNATQGSGYTWNVFKEGPTSVDYGDSCEQGFNPDRQIQIDVKWQRNGPTPLGKVSVTTNLKVENPASRNLDFDVFDILRDGEQEIDSVTCDGDEGAGTALSVPAGGQAVCTVMWNDVVFAENLDLNDRARAVPLELQPCDPLDASCNIYAEASAEIQLTGVSQDSSAVVVDTETLTGTDVTFSLDNFSSGSITAPGGYTLADSVLPAIDVVWNSGQLNGSGMETFTKTISLSSPTGTGALSDQAVVTPTDSQSVVQPGLLSTQITSTPLVDLTIQKSIEYALEGNDSDVQFCFIVMGMNSGYLLSDANDDDGSTPCITFGVGDPVSKSLTLFDLPPDTYKVTEQSAGGWMPSNPEPQVTTSADAGDFSSCADTVVFDNVINTNPSVKVTKITVPAGLEKDWKFTLTGPNTGQSGENCFTDDNGLCMFNTPLWPEQEYVITETDPREGVSWDGMATSNECSFTAQWPADYLAAKQFSCTWSNTQRGQIVINKQTRPEGALDVFDFHQNIAEPPGFQLNGSAGDDPVPNQIVFDNVIPASYWVREWDPSPDCSLSENPCHQEWDLILPPDPNAAYCDNESSFNINDSLRDPTDPNQINIALDPGESETCYFTNQQRGTIRVEKSQVGGVLTRDWTFEVRSDDAGSPGALVSSGTALAGGDGVIDYEGLFFVPDDYYLCERGVDPGWTTSLTGVTGWVTPAGELSDAVCVPFTLDAGEQPELFKVLNTPPDGEEPPGGLARTIGYWRNWSGDCTPGNQSNVLGRWLGLEPEVGDNPGPEEARIGLLVWPGLAGDPDIEGTLADAVNLISKRNTYVSDSSAIPCEKGANRASDPAYALASQFLAFQLNVNAGTSMCGLAQAADDAHWLLSDYLKFDGLDKGTGKKKKDVAWVGKRDDYISEFRMLASLFDRYNNKDHDEGGLQCPVTDYVAIDR